MSKTIGWLKGLACVAFFLTVPVIGLGAFFLLAMSSEQLHWNPDPMEALFVPLTWVGSLLLPFAGGVLWRTAKHQEPAAAPPAPRSSAARFRRWAWIAALVCALSLLATILWRQWPAPIGAWTPDRISASGPTAGPIVVHVETVSQRGLFVWVRLRSDYRGGTLRILPHFHARLATPTFPVPVQQPPEPANLPTVVLQLTPGQPPFESFMSSSKTATISGSKRVWIGFVFPSSAAASVAMKQIASLHSLRPRGLRADQPALLLFSLTARAVKPAPDETLRGEVSFELVPRTVGQPSNSQRPAKSAAR